MIYTLTFNPSLDYIIEVQEFKLGNTNRTSYEKLLPGGKGINVSIVLSNLGHESTMLGFVAGFTGNEIENRLKAYSCIPDFIHVKDGLSRINVKMKSQEETEINGIGPNILDRDLKILFNQLDEINESDILVISGSVPNNIPHTIYEDIMEHLKNKNVRIVVDATKDLLLKTLKYHPFLIKPNHHEIGELFGIELNSQDEVVPYAQKLQNLGVKNVLVSMGSLGAVLVDENYKIHKCNAPKGNLVNSVGAGDSMVAGFIAGYLDTFDFDKAFIRGVCTGSASAFSDELATAIEVEELEKQFINL